MMTIQIQLYIGVLLAAGYADDSTHVVPVVAPAFTPLPLGQVEPQGWLRDWAVSAKDGITGHLDERHPVFHDGWKGAAIRWTGAAADGTGWPIEQSAYWLDGAIRLGFILHDDALIKKIRGRLDPVVDGVNAGDFGTTFVYWKKNWKPTGFDGWAHSQMGRALFALYSGAGENRMLDALVKVYADYPSSMEWPEVNADVAGLCNLDAMMETCAASGDRRILELATAAIKRPDVRQRIQEWGVGKIHAGHMVITYEDIRLPAIMYPWTGDTNLLQASHNVFRWLDENHMLPYGLASGEEWAAGVGAARKTETCEIPAMLVSANWLYRIEGDGAWGDRMEKVFFNAGPAPISRDFQTAAYYQTPNRIKLGEMPVDSKAPTEMGGSSIRFDPLACDKVLCCIGACNRILPYFIPNMWMSTGDNGLAATLYGPCSVKTTVGAQVPVEIVCATDYPFNETIRMTVAAEKPVEFPLYLRVPGWCAEPAVEVNGKPMAVTCVKGFVKIARTWEKGDIVAIKLPMSVSIVRGWEGAYPQELRGYFSQISDVMFRPRALPYATVNCGPLLFALPIAEKDDNTPADGARFGYALDAHPSDAGKITITRRPMPGRWDWPLSSPVALNVPVRAFDWKPSIEQALPNAPVVGGNSETVALVPYGCTKFHISMFPVTPHAWEGMATPKLPKLSKNPQLLGHAGAYGDAASTEGMIVAFIDAPGAGAVWNGLPAGNKLKIRYSALNKAQLTLRINDGAPVKVAFPATGEWEGAGAYADVAVPVTIPANAKVKLVFETGDTPANIDSVESQKVP